MRGPANPEALQETAQQQHLETGREPTQQIAADEDDQTDKHAAFAPDLIGQRPVDQLTYCQTGKENGDNLLQFLRAAMAELCANNGKSRHNGVGA